MSKPNPPSTDVDLTSIPDELKHYKRWGLWKPVWRVAKSGKGRWEKMPLLSTNKPEDWLSFEEAVALWQKGGVGLGFCLTGVENLTAFDLDHCLDEAGRPAAWAADLMAKVGSYTEVTVSGDGIRMFCHGRYARDWVNKDWVSLEVYSGNAGRFVTLTGDIWPGSGEILRTLSEDELDGIAGEYRLASVEGRSAIGEMPELLDEVEVPDGLNAEAAAFLESGAGDDRSESLQWAARCLFEVGLDEVQVLSVLASNEFAMDVALDHRRQDEDRALAYLWQHHVCAAKDKARPVATEADFADEVEAPDPVKVRIHELSRMSKLDYEQVRKAEAKALGFREKVLDEAVEAARPKAKKPANSAVGDAVEEINQDHCVAWCGGSLSAMKYTKGDWLPTDMTSLRQWYANRPVAVTTADGDVEMKNPADLWLCSKDRKSYKSVEFVPGIRDLGDDVLNLWGGWALEPEHGDIEPFLELSERVVFAEDPLLIEWGLNWAAHMFQKPAALPGKALLLQSGQGFGKNTWIDTIKAPLGSAFLQVSSPKHLVGDFNGHLANKLLVHGAESVWGGDKSKVGPLKAMITDEDQAVEHKGKDVYVVRNYKRLVLSSNEGWPVPMDRDDRRFVVSLCKKAFEPHDPFWDNYRKWMANGGAARVFGFLLDRDISAFRPWERLPEITTSWRIKLQSSDALTKWWQYVLESGSIQELFPLHETAGNWMDASEGAGWSLAIPRKTFWAAFDEWCGRTRVRNLPEVHQRKDILREICPLAKEAQVRKLNRKPCFTFPTLAQCRVDFEQALGGGGMFSDEIEIEPYPSDIDDLL